MFGQYVDELVGYTLQKPRHAAKRFYVASNHLYSPSAVTNSAGQVVSRYTYDAYGRQTIRNPAGVAIGTTDPAALQSGFTGYRMDSETGLYFARARMYSAKLGRFMQRDIKYFDGSSLYGAYFIPNRLDPSGRYTVDEDCCARIDQQINSIIGAESYILELLANGGTWWNYLNHQDSQGNRMPIGVAGQAGYGSVNDSQRPECVNEVIREIENDGDLTIARTAWGLGVGFLGLVGEPFSEQKFGANTSAPHLMMELAIHRLVEARLRGIKRQCEGKKFSGGGSSCPDPKDDDDDKARKKKKQDDQARRDQQRLADRTAPSRPLWQANNLNSTLQLNGP